MKITFMEYLNKVRMVEAKSYWSIQILVLVTWHQESATVDQNYLPVCSKETGAVTERRRERK